MHSSGMRTVHLLTVSQHVLWRGGVHARGVYLSRGYLLGGHLPRYSPPVDRQTPVKT